MLRTTLAFCFSDCMGIGDAGVNADQPFMQNEKTLEVPLPIGARRPCSRRRGLAPRRHSPPLRWVNNRANSHQYVRINAPTCSSLVHMDPAATYFVSSSMMRWACRTPCPIASLASSAVSDPTATPSATFSLPSFMPPLPPSTPKSPQQILVDAYRCVLQLPTDKVVVPRWLPLISFA